MKKRMAALLLAAVVLLSVCPLGAFALEAEVTPNYRVAFYPYDCYHMKDDLGRYSGYGYELMQGVSKYLQATFSYEGYDHSAAECVELLREGELDIYTAAKRTAEREEEFAFTEHPAITSVTCLNVKISNKKIKAGDYSTYEGMRIGLLERHTYNPTVLRFIEEKGFSCQVVYYDTPTELSSALISDEVDAIADSFFRIPEDERTIENFGETPYYIMVRKEDEALARQIDAAIDRMNLETPNWRTELFIKYYGSAERNLELTAQEVALRDSLAASGQVLQVLMHPNNAPYSWMEEGKAKGIAVDIFKATADRLRLQYNFLPIYSKEDFEKAVAGELADVWIDMDTGVGDGTLNCYKLTSPYLDTTMSILRTRDGSEKMERIIIDHDTVTLREIASKAWPKAKILVADSTAQCERMLLSGQADAALMMSYTAQYLARQDLQNRFQAEIVPGASIQMRMGVKSTDNVLFYSLWEKALAKTADTAAEVVQTYLDETTTPTFLEYLFNHPMVLVAMVGGGLLTILLFVLFIQAQRSRRKQEKIAGELAAALDKAEEATKAKQTFFSKMSHDIRTPLNVVLGMTQIAQRYMNDRPKLENALNNINQEGNYLLVMINSILDVNQLEHGTIELVPQPFNPADCLRECADILSPLTGKKEQHMTVTCDCNTKVVRGDENRLKQILINIFSNAIKYTGMGGHIDLSLSCQPGNRYVFCCKDDGIGMSEEFIQRIGQEFTRAEDSRVSKTQGTGLGMSVVKGFTELMGGELTIHSTLGKGSVFCVELPFPEASEEEKEMVLRPSIGENEEPFYHGKKVLLVEDNALNAEIATELLGTIGLEVDWAENGEEGVKRFRSSQEDEYFAVFMDMQMPVMDGVTATKLIRASQRSDCVIPIFAMTANTFASDRRNCADAGMTGYIPKPVSVKDIEDALTEIKK